MTTPMKWPPRPIQHADIQPIFDALVAFLAQGYASCSVYASKDSSGATNLGATAVDTVGNTFNYTERIISSKVEIAPLSAVLGPGETQQFQATVTLADGTTDPAPTLSWYLVAPGLGTIDQTGLYTAPATITEGAVDTVEVGNADLSSARASVSLQP